MNCKIRCRSRGKSQGKKSSSYIQEIKIENYEIRVFHGPNFSMKLNEKYFNLNHIFSGNHLVVLGFNYYVYSSVEFVHLSTHEKAESGA